MILICILGGGGMLLVLLWGLSQIWTFNDWLVMVGLLIGLVIEIGAIGLLLEFLTDLPYLISGRLKKSSKNKGIKNSGKVTE